MTSHLRFVLTTVLSLAIQCFVAQPSARAGDINCSGLIGGGRTVATIDGNVSVPEALLVSVPTAADVRRAWFQLRYRSGNAQPEHPRCDLLHVG